MIVLQINAALISSLEYTQQTFVCDYACPTKGAFLRGFHDKVGAMEAQRKVSSSVSDLGVKKIST